MHKLKGVTSNRPGVRHLVDRCNDKRGGCALYIEGGREPQTPAVLTLPPAVNGEESRSEGPCVCFAGVSEYQLWGRCTGMCDGTASI